MDYSQGDGKTHFYGTGAPDPLRGDISLRNLQAKSARLFLKALTRNCLTLNLSTAKFSRLIFPRMDFQAVSGDFVDTVADIMKEVRANCDVGTERIHLAENLERDLLAEIANQNSANLEEKVDNIDGLWMAAAERIPGFWLRSSTSGTSSSNLILQHPFYRRRLNVCLFCQGARQFEFPGGCSLSSNICSRRLEIDLTVISRQTGLPEAMACERIRLHLL